MSKKNMNGQARLFLKQAIKNASYRACANKNRIFL